MTGGGGGVIFSRESFSTATPGLENMYVFKNHASAIFKLKQSEDDEYMSKAVTLLAK